jgi:phage terminase Nu1 subunit (DNA packaging protein)
MSINKKAFKTNKEKVFEGVAKRNANLRKIGEVEDKEGKKKKENEEKKKTKAELTKTQKSLDKIKNAKKDKKTRFVPRGSTRAY